MIFICTLCWHDSKHGSILVNNCKNRCDCHRIFNDPCDRDRKLLEDSKSELPIKFQPVECTCSYKDRQDKKLFHFSKVERCFEDMILEEMLEAIFQGDAGEKRI